MPNVVRNLGDAKRTRNVDGEEVERQDYIFLSTFGYAVPCLNTDTHFVFKSKRLGVATLCTCGSPAMAVGYNGYKRFASFMGTEVLACHNLIQYGVHSDGSH